MRPTTFALASALLLLAVPIEAAAKTIDVPQAEFGRLNAAQRQELRDKLIAGKIIEPGDQLRYSGRAIKQENLDPATIALILGTVGPLVCNWIVERAVSREKKACTKRPQAQRAKCTEGVDAKSNEWKGYCSLVSLAGAKK